MSTIKKQCNLTSLNKNRHVAEYLSVNMEGNNIGSCTHMARCGGRGCHEWFAEVRGPQNPSEILNWGSDEDPYQQFLLE